jgi:hypothetical protein
MFKEDTVNHWNKCENDTISAHWDKPHAPACLCDRVYKTVGREETSTMGVKGTYSLAGGLWFSHPSNGECTGNQRVGDGSGCTYKALETTRAIHAPCMYEKIDENIVNLN